MVVAPIAFDTHRFVKRLTGAGMNERQAEVLADEQVALLNANLATKAELADVEANLAARIAQVEASLEARIAQVEASLEARIAQVEANLRSEIAQVEASLEARIAQVEANLRSEIAQVEARLLRWMVGALIAQAGLIVGLLRLLS